MEVRMSLCLRIVYGIVVLKTAKKIEVNQIPNSAKDMK